MTNICTCSTPTPAGDCGGNPTAGHPVEIAQGRVVEHVIDWQGGPGNRLRVERYYASTYGVVGIAPNYRFSDGWISPYDSLAAYTLTVNPPVPNAMIRIMMPNSNQADFKYDGTAWQPINDTSKSYFIVSTNPNVVLQTPNGTQYTYGVGGGLISITEADGYSQFLTPVGVTDSYGQSLKFEYRLSIFANERKISAITTPDGNRIYYNYIPRQIPLPGAPGLAIYISDEFALGEVIYPDNTPSSLADNPRLKYEYWGDIKNPYALTKVTDERGLVKATWTYDAQGRALTARQENGAGNIQFSYDDINNKVTVTNVLGRPTVYSFELLLNGSRRIKQVDGVPTANCVAANTTYAYDANGFRSQATDAEGRVKTYTNDTLGRILSQVDGFGTLSAKTVSRSWDPVKPLPTQIVEPGKTTTIQYNSFGNVTQLSQVDTTTTVPYSTNGQTRTTAFGYTTFTAPVAPAIAASGTVLADVPLTMVNANAETGPVTGAITGWTNLTSSIPLAIATDGPCSTTNRCFYGATGNALIIAYQDVPVPSANNAEVDGGLRSATVSWLQDGTGFGYAPGVVTLRYLNASGQTIGTNLSSPRIAKSWEPRTRTTAVPPLTRTIRVRMAFNNGYFPTVSIDSVSLKLVGNGSTTAKPLLAVANPNALGGVTTGWTVSTPRILATNNAGAVGSAPCDVVDCFYSNGLPNGPGLTALGTDTMTQDIALPTALNAEIDASKRGLDVNWIDTVTTDTSNISVQIDFLDAANAVIASATTKSPSYANLNLWSDRTQYADVPALARKLRLTFNFNRPFPNITEAGYITGITAQLRERNFPGGTMQILTSVDGPLAGAGDKVFYAYDTKGNLSQVTNEVGLITKITAVDGAGRPTALLDPNNVVTNLTYDPRGRLTSITVNPGAAQAVTTIVYDLSENIAKIIRPDSSFLSYVWDSVPNVTTVTNNTGESITYGYDGAGHVTSSTVKSSAAVITKQMTMTYDEIGRLLKSIGAASQTTTLSYDRTDLNIQVKDPRNNLYGYAYDSLQRLVQTTNQDGAVVNVTRDGQDNVVGYQDPRLITTSYVRNGFGEVIREAAPDAGTTTYVRDLRGLVTQQTDGRGVVTNRSYDNAGRLLTETYPPQQQRM